MSDSDWYHVIHCSADGAVSYEQLDRKTLLERLGDKDPYYGTVEAFRLAPTEKDPQRWALDDEHGSKLLIIKGNVVQPRAKTVVTEYEI